MKALSERELGKILGRTQDAFGCYNTDIHKLISYIDYLHKRLDECDEEGMIGTEGWRHYFGVDE